jgi:hypothetical protein
MVRVVWPRSAYGQSPRLTAGYNPSSRAVTFFWISDVPPPIVLSRASR